MMIAHAVIVRFSFVSIFVVNKGKMIRRKPESEKELRRNEERENRLAKNVY